MYDAAGAFTAGLLTSAGPCVAPRFAAVAGLTGGKNPIQAAKLTGAFCAGLLMAYASFAAAGWIAQSALRNSQILYAGIACALAAAGAAPLLRKRCSHAGTPRRAPGTGGAFLLGASLALVVSPCCAPVVLAMSAYAASAADARNAAFVLVCYGAGHAVPLVAAACTAHKAAAVFTAISNARATVLVSSSLLLAMAGYYAVLA